MDLPLFNLLALKEKCQPYYLILGDCDCRSFENSHGLAESVRSRSSFE